MLVLSRKPGQSVRVADSINVTILSVSGNRVLIGFAAPDDARIVRTELIDTTKARVGRKNSRSPGAPGDLVFADNPDKPPTGNTHGGSGR